ncbi:sensor histidine kinase [Shewanella sp. NIFS-20-20]|uniref:sensor histidine kinase n=1 Tax=Shewanella sp. NIFS-20-20 TaxID=2853806 RepID=UPI001C439E4E|nr:HAMP domain-containing sensor histidine kinase [Shewanella sp. NIFS-20-20]MBV7317001.1 HAMP domain-containing histidine kinase [Shewanella sp. NIFS-20-20]
MRTFLRQFVQPNQDKRLWLAITLACVILVLLISSLQLSVVYHEHQQHQQQQFEQLSQHIAAQFAKRTHQHTPVQIEETLALITALPQVNAASLRIQQQHYQAGAVNATEPVITQTIAAIDGELSLQVIAADNQQAFWHLTLLTLLLSSLQTLLVGIIALYLLWHFVSRHLHQLSDYCDQLINDDKVPALVFTDVSPNSDLNKVAAAINQTQHHLRQSYSELLESKQTLENVLKERNRLLQNEWAYKEELSKQIKEQTKEVEQSLLLLSHTQRIMVEQEKMAALSGLVSGVAHEINTPIGICLTAASSQQQSLEQIEELLPLPTTSLEDIIDRLNECNQASALIINNVNKASDLIQRFKTVAAQQCQDAEHSMNLWQLVEELQQHQANLFGQYPAEVTLDIDPSLHITTDQQLLSQILSNLLTNTYCHAFTEDGDNALRLSASTNDGKVLISVEDNGPGVADDEIAKIFEPFYTTRRSAGNTGLGLSAAFNAATQLQGQLEYSTSQQLGGACLTLTIPLEYYYSGDIEFFDQDSA